MASRVSFGGRRRAEPRLIGGSDEKEGDRAEWKAWKDRARGRRNLKVGYLHPFSVYQIAGRGC